MTPLTQIFSAPHPKNPLLMEVPIPEELDGPFLVTSAKAQLWVGSRFPSGNLRAAVRKAPREFLFREALISVWEKSQELSWGSAQPATKQGLHAAISHVVSFGIGDVEVLFGEGFDQTLVPEGTSSQEEVWVPKGWAVAIPIDRSFVGTLFDFGRERHAMVLHNASRALGVLGGKF